MTDLIQIEETPETLDIEAGIGVSIGFAITGVAGILDKATSEGVTRRLATSGPMAFLSIAFKIAEFLGIERQEVFDLLAELEATEDRKSFWASLAPKTNEFNQIVKGL